jgi:diaminohydroxyphosphoribosylaminopyrimidine deaminase/5-amino-6-(5-phosphoribosylamino)uracil reductase
MVGSGTLLADNPRLTVRDWPGKNPLRIVPDRRGRLPMALQVFSDEADTLLFTTHLGEDRKHLRHILLSSDRAPVQEILGHLATSEIQSLLVEGGARLLESFINSGLWDEARVFTGTKSYGSGLRAPILPSTPGKTIYISSSRLDIYINTENH